MKFLIPTEPDDTHAIIVKLALDELKHETTLLFTADQPTRQKNSIFVDNEQYRWQCMDHFSSIQDNDYDIIWWRRARKPYLPKELIHPEDYKFVVRENTLFYEAFTHNMGTQAWWINSKEAAQRANFKLLQLKVANECGMTIPTTLCSNDPQEIHAFLNQHKASGVIYKPLCTNYWPEAERVKVAYTARISQPELPNNFVLQRTPGIYQKEIAKKYELRVTCFGDFLVAAKLNSQIHPEGQVDWRVIQDKRLPVELYELPKELAINIRKFMHTLGIVFGAFDFIVTPDNEYVFLEVNEQGQFLWIEEYNPEIKMLDIFINFLLQGSTDFEWKAEHSMHSIERYRPKIDALFNQNMLRHVDLNRRSHTLQHHIQDNPC